MKRTLLLFIVASLAYGQTANVQKSTATATLNQISGDLTFGSGKTLTLASGSTFSAQAATFAGAIGASNGSAAAPSISFASDTGQGWFLSSSRAAMASSGSVLMRGHNAAYGGIDVYDTIGFSASIGTAIDCQIGRSGTGLLIQCNTGNSNITLTPSGTGAVRFSTYGAGSATFDSSGNITSVSDARMKNITGTFTKGLAEIVKLTPKLYTWKPETGLVSDDVVASLIAQDLIAAGIPEAVSTYRTIAVMENDAQSAEDIAAGKPVTQHAKLDAAGKPVTQRVDANYSVSDRTVIAALVNAVKELKTEIDALKAR